MDANADDQFKRYIMCIIKFGWAEVDITPDWKVALAGQFAERISEYVEKTITATAMAVSNDDDQMILVSCDLVGTPCNLIDAVREVLKDNEVGMCRRAVYSDGTAQMWGDTDKAVFTELEGGSDTGIELMYVFNKTRKLTGIVANHGDGFRNW